MIFPPLPQPDGTAVMVLLRQVSAFFQLVAIVVGMIATGVLLIWWKLRTLNLFHPAQLHGATIHKLDPSSYRDDTGTSR